MCASWRKEVRSINPVADILVAIVLHGKKDYVKNTTHNIQGMLLDIYSQHQVNCTCQRGHAYKESRSKRAIICFLRA